MKKEIEKIIKNYAHDFRDMEMNVIQLDGLLVNFTKEIEDQIKTDLLKIANKDEFEKLRITVEEYFKESVKMKNRVIKFRAKRKRDKVWVYGLENPIKSNELTLGQFWNQVKDGFLDRKTLGQFIELLDKQSKEIYGKEW